MKVILTAVTTGAALVLIVGVITAMYSEQAFAMKPTSLSFDLFPSGGKVNPSTSTLKVGLSGKLTSQGSEVGGAPILITGAGKPSFDLKTTSFGSYGTSVTLGPGTHTIQAFFPGGADYISASATRVITVTP